MLARTSLRIAVCDDSPIFLNKTKTYIETWSANTGHAVQILPTTMVMLSSKHTRTVTWISFFLISLCLC